MSGLIKVADYIDCPVCGNDPKRVDDCDACNGSGSKLVYRDGDS